MILNFIITIAEIIGGLLAGSLSLLSDALHNSSDGISIIISYLALRLKICQNSYRHTFGLKRAEILAAVINSAVLLGIAGYLFSQAISRFIHPPSIRGGWMTTVASVGLIANVVGTTLVVGFLTRWLFFRRMTPARFQRIRPIFPIISGMSALAVVFVATSLKADVILKKTGDQRTED